MVLEKEIESYLAKQVKLRGGYCLKWVSPSTSFVPDRIVLAPKGKIYFIEMKRPGGRLSEGQKRFHAKLAKLDIEVFVLSSREEVDTWLMNYMSTNKT